MQHLDEGTIHAWLDDALPADAARDAEQHVATCAQCAALVAEARGMIAGASRIVSSLDVVRGGVIPKQRVPASRSLWRSLHLTPVRAALAASLMVAAATLLTFRHDTANKMVPGASAVREADAPAVTSPAASAPPPQVADAAAGRATQPQRDATQPKAKEEAAVANEARQVVADARQRSLDSIAAAPASQKPDVVNVAPPAVVAQKAAAPTAPSAPVAGAAAGATSARVESMADLAKVSADSARLLARTRADNSFAPRAAAERNDQLQLRSQTMRRVSTSFTCYQLAVDTTTVERGIPVRFALDFLGGDSTRRVVRAMTADGFVDSVLTGSRWTQTSEDVFVVRFSSDNARELTLRLGGAVVGGFASTTSGSRSRTLAISRIQCRP